MQDQGFQKIKLPSNNTGGQVNMEVLRKKKELMARRKKSIIQKTLTIITILFGLGIILTLVIAVPARAVFVSVQKTAVKGKELATVLKSQDLDKAKKVLTETKQQLAETKSKAQYLSWTGFIPFFGAYYRDFNHGLNASNAGLEAIEISIDSVIPYADLLGLKGKGTFTSGSANERLRTAIVTFDKITPRLSEISEKVEIVKKEISQIDPNRYPKKFGNKEIRSTIIKVKDITDEMSTLFVSARPFLEDLPEVMGYPEPKTYLVFFKNDKELRPDGGFITAYAVFKMDEGKPIVEKADDIYKLDKSRTRKVAAPAEILKYHKGVYQFNLRDSNLSPDFAESIKMFEKLYQDVPGKINYDGIITVDTHVLVEAMKILGSFNVYDRTFNAENDPRCDCPRVVYELEDYSSRPVAYVREERKDIIGVLLLQIMQKALGVSPSQYWGNLFQMGIRELNEKHILIYLENKKDQQAIESLNWGGRIKEFTGDYLHINDANMAGAKSDLFVQRKVKIEYSKGSNDVITKTLTLDYKNPAPPSNCNLEAGELCLNGLLRNWVRIYVPKGSKLIDFKGSEMDPVVKEDLGKTVFEGFLTVKPQGASQVIVKYTLPVGLTDGNKLLVLIQKQPGTEGHEYEIVVDGKTIDNFELRTDKELTIKL